MACSFRNVLSVHRMRDIGDVMANHRGATCQVLQQELRKYRHMFGTFMPGKTVLTRVIGYSTISVIRAFFDTHLHNAGLHDAEGTSASQRETDIDVPAVDFVDRKRTGNPSGSDSENVKSRRPSMGSQQKSSHSK